MSSDFHQDGWRPRGGHRPTLTRPEIDALADQIAKNAAHLDAATHTLLSDLRTFDREGGWFRQGARSCAEWLSWRLHWNIGTAREHLRVANALGKLPLIDDALRKGELSYAKVRAITRVATTANESMLLTDARYSTGQQLELICRKYASVKRRMRPSRKQDAEDRKVTRRDLEDGLVRIEAVLHPEEAQAVWEALTRVARERTAPRRAAQDQALNDARARAASFGDDDVSPEATAARNLATKLGSDRAIERMNGRTERFSRADALVEIAQGVLRGNSPDRSPTELVVTIPADVLDRSNPDALQIASGADGTCISAETARRLACDCGVVHIHEDANGNSINVGRKYRSLSASLKRALLKRDTTCRFPGCCNRVYVQGHHIQHWVFGGETKLDNLICLCDHHHRFVHEYGYTVTLDEKQQSTFFTPSGKPVPDVPSRPTTTGLSDLKRLNAPLKITASTNAPRWTGDRVDYPAIIDGLLRVDRLI
ncbi:MAG TPA: DUF222 domain-containing protein [Kofleriaceae bacterium]|jgi:hypothetical protein